MRRSHDDALDDEGQKLPLLVRRKLLVENVKGGLFSFQMELFVVLVYRVMATLPALLTRIQPRILTIRKRRVMLDAQLAELYGVTAKRLREQVRRNRERFPDDCSS